MMVYKTTFRAKRDELQGLKYVANKLRTLELISDESKRVVLDAIDMFKNLITIRFSDELTWKGFSYVAEENWRELDLYERKAVQSLKSILYKTK